MPFSLSVVISKSAGEEPDGETEALLLLPPPRLANALQSPSLLPSERQLLRIREPGLCGGGVGKGCPQDRLVWGSFPRGLHASTSSTGLWLTHISVVTHWTIHLGTVQLPGRKTALMMCHETMISVSLIEKLGTGWLCGRRHLHENASPSVRTHLHLSHFPTALLE